MCGGAALKLRGTTMTEPLSGAQFARQVGTDPEKWAQAFVRAYAGEMREAEINERVSWVTPWFRDAMDAAVKANWREGLDEALRAPLPTRTWDELKEIAERQLRGDKPSD
jgi:hypothetical protein